MEAEVYKQSLED